MQICVCVKFEPDGWWLIGIIFSIWLHFVGNFINNFFHFRIKIFTSSWKRMTRSCLSSVMMTTLMYVTFRHFYLISVSFLLSTLIVNALMQDVYFKWLSWITCIALSSNSFLDMGKFFLANKLATVIYLFRFFMHLFVFF
jgi:hypothetical protein